MDEKKGRHKASHEITPFHFSNNSRHQQRLSAAVKSCPRGACRRLLTYLAQAETPCSTAELSGNCAIGNVGDAAAKVNTAISLFDLLVMHKMPDKTLKNRFGEASLMHVWWLQDVAIEESKEASL